MKLSEGLLFAKNSMANVFRGGVAALVAILLPPFLTRHMSTQAFGVWCLILQLAAYVGYLEFGLQTAVGRFTAHCTEKGDLNDRDAIISTAFAALGGFAVIGIIGGLVTAIFLPRIFPQMPENLIGPARWALLLVSGSLAVGLPFSVFNGVFVGLLRNEVPAAIVGGSRILSAVVLVVLVRRLGGAIVQMGLVVAAANLASYMLQYIAYRHLSLNSHFSFSLVSRRIGRQLFDYCLSLSIWSLAMLLVNGLDLALVGYFRFEALAYYGVAASLIMFLAGLQNAVFGVMIPSSAILHARGNKEELGRIMVTATRYGAFLLLLTGIPLLVFANKILAFGFGQPYGTHGAQILQILVSANVIRLSATAYVMTLIGTGEQKLVKFTPMLEGVSNLVASLIFGYLYGALGVAIGTLVGSVIGFVGHTVYNMPRTQGITFRISDYLRNGLLRPVICMFPFIAWSIMTQATPPAHFIGAILSSTFLCVGMCIVIWHWGLVDSEREKLRLWRWA